MRYCLLFLATFLLSSSLSAQPREVRGVWITNVDSQVMFSKAALAEAMDYLASRGFNVVYPVVWNKGYTLHPSETMEELFGIRQDPVMEGRDPLAEIIVEAHRNGMEVIAWFEYGFATEHTGTDTPPQGSSHIAQTFPEWLARDRSGDILKKNGFEWMNGLHPEVQDFMLSLVREVIENYDVDGIQGDDRLPAMPSDGGYSDFTRALYAAEHDGATVPANPRQTDFLQWKADKLTAFAGRLYRMVKEHDDDLTVSFSPSIYPWSLQEYLQDWPRWLDSSYVDIVHPQAYRWDISAYESTMQAMIGSQPGLYNGYVDAEHIDRITPGLIIKAGSQFNDWAYVEEALAFNRAYGIDGEVYFFYEGLREKNDFLADSLHSYFYGEPAIMPTREDVWRRHPAITHEGDATPIGTWTEASASGFEGGMLRTDPASGASLTWTMAAPEQGTYDVYAYQPQHRRDATRRASFSATDGSSTSTAVFDQWSTSVQGWMPVGRFELETDQEISVTLASSEDGAVYGDAVMLLPNRNPSSRLQVPTSAASPPEVPAQGQLIRIEVFPHPARDTTNLSFTLAETSKVSVEIFDALGRRVLSLQNGAELPAGRHSVHADVSSLAAGVYLCSVRSAEASASTPIIVLK